MTSLKMDALAARLQEITTAGPKMITPGIVLTVTDKNGNRLYEKSEGTIGLHRTEPVHPQTLMWIASEGKLITTVLAMKLVEDGLWKLDDPVDDVLPELKGLPVVDAEGNVIKEHADNKITLRHLLTHTSGLTYPAMNPAAAKWRKANGLSSDMSFFGYKPEDFPSAPLVFEPGHGWAYGTGIDWAGFLVSRLRKKDLETYLQEALCKPLGMTSTTFSPEKYVENYKEKLMDMTNQVPGGLADIDTRPPTLATGEYGGHGLFSTPDDYSKILGMVLRNGEGINGTRILKKETVDEMFRPQLEGDDLKMLQETADSPMGTLMQPGIAGTGMKVNYGLSGLINMSDYPGRRKAGSLNWGGMPNLMWWVDRKSGIAVNSSTQLLPTAEGPIVDFIVEIEKEVYKELVV